MIRQILIHLFAIALILLGLQQYPVLAEELNHHSAHTNITAFSKAMEIGMEKMMSDMHQSGMTNDPDVDFLAMMIPHHEGAVEMARLVLIYGKDPLVRQLAEEMIASQQVEVAAMRSRLPLLKQGENLDPDGFPAIHGTRGTPAHSSQPDPV
jgi:Domain of unknown function (DUF305)